MIDLYLKTPEWELELRIEMSTILHVLQLIFLIAEVLGGTPFSLW